MEKKIKRIIFIRTLVKKIKNLPKEFKSNTVLLSSSVSPIFHNWGDDASIVIAQLINPKANILHYQYVFNVFGRNNVLSVGSIITWLTTPNTIIWGSGVQRPEDDIIYNGKVVKPKKILAVRGPLTREYFLKKNIPCPEVFGDPALLFPRYYQPKVEKKYKIGIIPHFKDKNSESLNKFRNNKDYHFIDIQDFKNWNNFIDEINSCEFILSSSLHGIIISDAYGIPNAWIEFGKKNLKRFTFQDYFYAVNKQIDEPISLDSLGSVEDIQNLRSQWKAPEIDLEPLLAACPFSQKINP